MPKYRSWSQLSDYEKCPYSYYLKRVEKVWTRPAAWLPMGTAVHEAGEAWENSGRTMPLNEAVQVAKDSYVKEMNRYLEKTPDPARWSTSGPYKGPEDIERRYGLLTEHVANYVRYYSQDHPEILPVELTAEDGTKLRAIELPFVLDLDGVEVRGFIDKVEEFKGKPRVVDLKTGASAPKEPDQLKVYALAMEDHGLQIESGAYFLTKRGTPTRPYDLTKVTRQDMVNRFHAADAGIREERWLPIVGDHCGRCDVNASCEFWKRG